MNYMQIGFFLATLVLIVAAIAVFRPARMAAKGWMLGFLILSLLSQAFGYLPFLLLPRGAMAVADYGRILETTSIASRILEVIAWLCLLRFLPALRSHSGQLPNAGSDLPADAVQGSSHDSQSAQPVSRAGESTITTVCGAIGAATFIVLNLVTSGAVPGGFQGALAGIVLGWGVGWMINFIRRRKATT